MIEKISEKKWFSFCSVTNEIDINTLNSKTNLIVLIQKSDDISISLYGCVKKQGLFSFKNIYKNLDLIITEKNHVLLNNDQNLNKIIDIVSKYFSNITSNINFYMYEHL